MTDGNYHEVCEASACCHHFLSNLALPAAHQLQRSFKKQTNDAASPNTSHRDLHEFGSAKQIFILAIGDDSHSIFGIDKSSFKFLSSFHQPVYENILNDIILSFFLNENCVNEKCAQA